MMIQLKPPAASCVCLDHSHVVLAKHLQHFEEHLFRLRYEGKPLFGKNIKNTRETLRVLTREMETHFKMEEKVIFPFLGRHVPRLSPVIQLLHADHEELEKCLLKLKDRLNRAAQASRKNASDGARQIREVQEMGNYVIQFVSNHLKAEDSIIHGSIKRELRPEEEKLIFSRISRLMRGKRVQRGQKKN